MSDTVDEYKRPRRKPIGEYAVGPPPDGVIMYTFGQVAYLLQISTTTVRRMADNGAFAVVHVGSLKRVSKVAFADYLRKAEYAHMTPEQRAESQKSDTKAREAKRLRAIIKAEWNTGEDFIGLSGNKPGRPRKKPSDS